MNEHRDPITEWTSAIESRIWHAIAIIFIAAFIMGLIAPIFGMSIRASIIKALVMEPDCFQIADRAMPKIWIALWVWAAICWFILIFTNLHPLTS